MVCFCVYISYICGYCECSLLPVNDHLILLIYVFLSNGTIFNDLDDYKLCDGMLARYILCYGPVFVFSSVWLGAEGPRDVKLCRGPASRRRLCGLLLHARSTGAVCPSTRPIVIGAMVKQLGGQRAGSALLF